MKMSQTIQSYKDYHRINSKKNRVKNYEFIFTQFQDEFGDRFADSIIGRYIFVSFGCEYGSNDQPEKFLT
jgi:hypothetical protein